MRMQFIAKFYAASVCVCGKQFSLIALEILEYVEF